jgi:hypothetical protein
MRRLSDRGSADRSFHRDTDTARLAPPNRFNPDPRPTSRHVLPRQTPHRPPVGIITVATLRNNDDDHGPTTPTDTVHPPLRLQPVPHPPNDHHDARCHFETGDEFSPRYDVEIRRVICSTNAIESLNARYRRAIKGAQRVRDHLRRPIPGSRDLLMETAGNTVSEIVPTCRLARPK